MELAGRHIASPELAGRHVAGQGARLAEYGATVVNMPGVLEGKIVDVGNNATWGRSEQTQESQQRSHQPNGYEAQEAPAEAPAPEAPEVAENTQASVGEEPSDSLGMNRLRQKLAKIAAAEAARAAAASGQTRGTIQDAPADATAPEGTGAGDARSAFEAHMDDLAGRYSTGRRAAPASSGRHAAATTEAGAAGPIPDRFTRMQAGFASRRARLDRDAQARTGDVGVSQPGRASGGGRHRADVEQSA